MAAAGMNRFYPGIRHVGWQAAWQAGWQAG
jgi:hypothetical protein